MSLSDESKPTELYAHLTKITEGSNKFYNVYIKECTQGMSFCGSEKTASHDGYEVYSYFGGIGAPSFRQRHVGFYFYKNAAIRAAKRLKEEKLQKRYVNKTTHSEETYQHLEIPIEKTLVKKTNTEKTEEKINFPPIPQPELKRTATQRKRFSNLNKSLKKQG